MKRKPPAVLTVYWEGEPQFYVVLDGETTLTEITNQIRPIELKLKADTNNEYNASDLRAALEESGLSVVEVRFNYYMEP